jgi:hypothetical protein
MYMVKVHDLYCITVVLVYCSALKDSYRNKRIKEWNTQKIEHRKSKIEKMNSNEFDGWQMQAACKEREEMKALASGQ